MFLQHLTDRTRLCVLAIAVIKPFLLSMYYRRRVPQASEKGTTKPTRCADVVVDLRTIFRSRDVLSVATPTNACATVSISLIMLNQVDTSFQVVTNRV